MRSLLAFWVGGASAESTTQAGARSLLAPWVGGASAAAGDTPAGVRSMLAPWVGGAAAGAPDESGYRGLLALWLGGAAGSDDAPPTPHPSRGVVVTRAHLLRMQQARRALAQRNAKRRKDEIEQEDDALAVVAPQDAAPADAAPPSVRRRKRGRRTREALIMARLRDA